ncbi:MAG: hypothetical protein KDE35_05405 [Geminicoccaceae bacterium]|nr:hypothetical protein [Geminicoccaceae bacterium]
MIGDNGYRLIRFSGRSLVEVSIWPRDEAGRQAAMARLHTLDEKTFGGCHLSVLVDSIEQTYRREELPAGNALDRRRIVERRLDVAFPATPLRRAIPLRAREPSGTARTAPEKPDGRLPYLFAALPPNDDLEHWCGTLPTLDRPVEGLGLLPLETAARTADLRRLVEAGRTSGPTADGAAEDGKDAGVRRDAGRRTALDPWLLIVGRAATGGVRQIVLHQGELALTRLAKDLPQDPHAQAAQLQRDVHSTLGYLARLGYQRGAPLSILAIADARLGDGLLELGPPAAGVVLRTVTPVAALAALGIRSPGLPADEACADPVFAALVAGRPLHLPFATARMNRERRVWRALHGLRTALALALLGVLALTALDVRARFEAETDLARLTARHDDLQTRSAMLTDRLRRDRTTGQSEDERPGDQETGDEGTGRQHDADRRLVRAPDLATIRRIVAIRDRLEPASLDHEAALDRLLASLTPELRLVRLQWHRVGEDERRPANRGPATPDGGALRPFDVTLTVDLSRLQGAAEAIAATEAFARTLARSFPDHDVHIERHAVDVLPQQALVGGIGGPSLRTLDERGSSADIVLRASAS